MDKFEKTPLIKVGFLSIFFGFIILPLELLLRAIMFALFTLGGVSSGENFLDYMVSISWRFPLGTMLMGISLVAVGILTQLIFIIPYSINRLLFIRKSNRYQEYRELVEYGFDPPIRLTIINGVTPLGCLTTYALVLFSNLNATLMISLLISVITLLIYASFIVNKKELGIWRYYKLRYIILPYAITDVFVVFLIFAITIICLYIETNVINASGIEFLVDKAPDVEKIINETVMNLEFWLIPKNDIIQSIIYSTIILISVIWLLPLIIKKNIFEIGAMVISVGVPTLVFLKPSIMEILSQRFITMIKSISDEIPIPLISVFFLLLFDYFNSKIKSILKLHVTCKGCNSKIAITDRYCKTCGTFNDASEY